MLECVHEQRLNLIIASSAEPDELQGLLQAIGPHTADLFALQTSAQEVEHSKPDPDVLSVAVQRSGYNPQELVMVGDTPYDIEAAAKVKVKTVAFRCGGWSDKDLAGTISIYDGPADLLAHYETSVFVKGI